MTTKSGSHFYDGFYISPYYFYLKKIGFAIIAISLIVLFVNLIIWFTASPNMKLDYHYDSSNFMDGKHKIGNGYNIKYDNTESLLLDANSNSIGSDEEIDYEELDFLHGNTIIEWKSPKFRILSKKYIKTRIYDLGKLSKSELTIKEFQKKFYKGYVDPNDLTGDYPGKKGLPVNSTYPEDSKEYQERYDLYKFNELASNMIPLVRELPYHLSNECANRKYPIKLPDASVIIVHHNEAESTLLRTIHSVYANSPYYLIKEVILIDDATDLSIYPHLSKEKIYEKLKMFPSVIYIRSEERIGLIDAKLLGAKKATGNVLVFLDSHCECFPGWLEPLLLGISLNPRTSITPVIEVINFKDFSVKATPRDKNVGIFSWGMSFGWSHINEKEADPTRPFLNKSPTMAGGLLAIDRKFFFEVGSYDQEMKMWGSENLEMSFRLWTCADGIFIDTCSHVGHVFRESSPHHLDGNIIHQNTIRLVESWLDDYKEKYYRTSGGKKIEIDVSKRLELRERLKCRPFKWFLDHVAKPYMPDLNQIFEGQIKNINRGVCFDNHNKASKEFDLMVYPCHDTPLKTINQVVGYTTDKQLLINSNKCLDSMSNSGPELPVKWGNCHGGGGNQHWILTESGQIKNPNSGHCLTIVHSQEPVVRLLQCSSDNPDQKWEFYSGKTKMNKEILDKF